MGEVRFGSSGRRRRSHAERQPDRGAGRAHTDRPAQPCPPVPRPAGPRRSVVASVAGCAALLVSFLCGTGAGAAAPTPSRQATAALDWLSARMAANGSTVPGFTPGSTDWGLTADAVLALVAAGRATGRAAVDATDRLTADASTFTTWTWNGFVVRDAGATGKAVLALRSMGRPATAAGVDLEAELRSLMRTTGAQAGRFSDRVPEPTADAANGVGQAESMMALALTSGGVPAPSVAFLLRQQCADGGFRLTYGTSAGCSGTDVSDTDATAVSLQALLSVPRTTEVATALRRGADWLLSKQGADGSFGGTGPTAAANTNSTGLIGQFLRAAGETAAADRAAAWITSCCQLTDANAPGTAAAADIGAIAYSPAALSAALAHGITTRSADQWYRTGTQAVLALGLAPYGRQDVEPITPSTSATTSSTPATVTTAPVSTTAVTTSTTTVSTSTTTGSTTAASDGTAAAPPPSPVVAGVQTAPGPGTTTGVTSTPLAMTGSADVSAPLRLGVLLVLAGTAVLAATRRRDPAR